MELEKMQQEIVSAVETKLEEKKEAIAVSLEEKFEEKLNAHKQEMIELSKASSKTVAEATEVEKVQLQKLNSCLKEGAKEVSLEDLRAFNDKLTEQTRRSLRGENVKLDATLAGFAGFDDPRGGALIIPEYDKNIRQDFADYDEGLFNSINFAPAMSRTKKIVVDTVEPDENVAAVKETLQAINYTIDDGCFVSTTLNLKDYDNPARITYDEIEDAAFRVENYVNGKLVQGIRRKVAKDLWIGDSAEAIKGIFNYPQGNGYGKVGVVKVAQTGVVTMDDIMKLCLANRNKGVLFIDRATWGKAISAKDSNGRYLFELGSVAQGQGAQPFHVDAVVPFHNVPVVFDDVFTEAKAIAKNIGAAILPVSAVAGYKRPVARFMIDDKLKTRDMLLTERYDAVLTQFKYVKLLSTVQ